MAEEPVTQAPSVPLAIVDLVTDTPDGPRPVRGVASWVPQGASASLTVDGLVDALCVRAGAVPGAVVRLRAAVAALADEGVHVVVHAPLADADTTPEELMAAVSELVGLALRFRDRVTFVETAPPSTPRDVSVLAALATGLVSADGDHTATLTRLRDAWSQPTVDLDTLLRVRQLDDAPRRAVFSVLRDAWLGRAPGWPAPPERQVAMDTAVAHLGETEAWMKRFRQYTYEFERRMVLIPTWQCELRCSYCYIPKQDGREMSLDVAERGVDLLLSSEQRSLMLQFFGGEALLAWPVVQHAIERATARGAQLGKRVSYVISSNGWSLDADKLAWMKGRPIRLELSLDGDARTQNRFRPSRWRDQKSYDHSIVTHRDAILESGVDQFVIMVVHPTNVDAMPDSFFHLADQGFRTIQINNMLGRAWTPAESASFAKGLHRIGQEIVRRRQRGEVVELVNRHHRPVPMRLNGEVTVDWDGTIYGGNQFLHETEHKDKFVIGHLDDRTGIDRFWIDATDNNFLLDWAYRPSVTANNVEVGKVMASFTTWLNKQLGGVAHHEASAAP